MKSPEGKFQKTSTGAVRMQPKSDELKFVTKNDGYVHIHPSSVNYQVRTAGCTHRYIWQVGWEIQSLKSSQTMLSHLLCPAASLAKTGKQTTQLGDTCDEEKSVRDIERRRGAVFRRVFSVEGRTLRGANHGANPKGREGRAMQGDEPCSI